jgi:hypothetical protein
MQRGQNPTNEFTYLRIHRELLNTSLLCANKFKVYTLNSVHARVHYIHLRHRKAEKRNLSSFLEDTSNIFYLVLEYSLAG